MAHLAAWGSISLYSGLLAKRLVKRLAKRLVKRHAKRLAKRHVKRLEKMVVNMASDLDMPLVAKLI